MGGGEAASTGPAPSATEAAAIKELLLLDGDEAQTRCQHNEQERLHLQENGGVFSDTTNFNCHSSNDGVDEIMRPKVRCALETEEEARKVRQRPLGLTRENGLVGRQSGRRYVGQCQGRAKRGQAGKFYVCTA